MKLLSTAPRPKLAGFTLIELLTVISIIAILAAASFGAYTKITEGVRRKEGSVMAMAVSNAVTQFYADYNRLPKPVSATDGADNDCTTESADGLVKVLLGKEGEVELVQNSRNTNYLEGIKPAKKNATPKPAFAGASADWTNGLVSTDETVEIVDPWGNYFKVRLDGDYNSELENPSLDEVAEGRTTLPKRMLVWSSGKDGKEETWEDNVKSWD